MPHYGTPQIWRLDQQVAGSGALGDLGAHIIDMARYLVGDISEVVGMTETFMNISNPYIGERRAGRLANAVVRHGCASLSAGEPAGKVG